MQKANTLLKDTVIYSIGNFGSKILSFLLLPLYTFFLSKAELGDYDLLITTVNLFVPLITMQVSDGVYRWLLEAKLDVELKMKAVSSSFFIVSLSMCLFFILYYILTFFFEFPYSLYFILVLSTSCYLPFFQQIIRGLGKNKVYSFIGIMTSFLILIFNVLFLYIFKLGLEGLFLTIFISNIIGIIIILLHGSLYKLIDVRRVSLIEIKALLRYSWPMILNVMSWWIINSSDKFMILYFLGSGDNGIYAVAGRFPAIIMIVNSIFLMSFQDHALKGTGTREEILVISSLFKRFLRFELCFVLILTLMSPLLVKYMVGSAFQSSWRYMPFLYLGVAFSALSAYIGIGYQLTKNTIGLNSTTLIGAGANTVIGLIFIKHVGLYAPAIGTLISFLLIYVFRFFRMRSFLQLEIDFGIQVFLISLILLATAIIHLQNDIVTYVAILLSLVVSWLVNRDSFANILSQIFNKRL